MLGSENKQMMLKEAFIEVGTCSKAIDISRIANKDGFVLNEFLFFEVNLFREVRFFNLMVDSNSCAYL
ncbi:hypothetical protein [Prochlorococcus marinus]|uniref:hypothetical protein n=1 Tax=Prochlorococcus marinus TaxID=1219 RepID=UPI001650337B|nr:hypothetical protein [Prochlorococcus marinus]